MSTPTRSDLNGLKIDKVQEVAAFRLLPFTVDLFQGAPLRLVRADHMPIGLPEALTLEVVEALAAVIERGTLAFLCRAGAWQRHRLVEPGRDEPSAPRRGIDPAQWRGQDRRLRFSSDALETVMLTYNAVCLASGVSSPMATQGKRTRKSKSSRYPEQLSLDFEHNGDLIAHHIVWRRVREANFQLKEPTWQALCENPLTAVARLDTRQHEAAALFDRLFAPDMAPSWPWLWEYLEKSWELEFATRWDNLARFDRLNQALAAIGEELLARSRREGRRDYLLPLLRFHRRHFAAADLEERWLRDFNRIARDFKLADRDQYRRTWARVMRLGYEVQREYEEARHIHPVDREAGDKIFMSEVERAPYAEIGQRALHFANTLNSVIA